MGKWGARSVRLRELAASIVRDAGVAERDQVGEAKALHAWVQERIRYVYSPIGAALLVYPETAAFVVKDADCKVATTLEAALLGTLGIVSRFVVVGFPPAGTWSHVYLQALVKEPGRKNRTWLSLDPIVKNRPAGWEVPDATTRKDYPNNGSTTWARLASARERGAVVASLIAGALFAVGVFRARRARRARRADVPR